MLSIPLLVASALFIPSHVIPSARGQFTGLVCIVFPVTSTSCPTSSPTIGPLRVGQTFTVGVFIQNSPPLGGFDIYVSVNPTYLHPLNASLGPVITSPSLTTICVNGSAQTGVCTPNTVNGSGVVEVSTIESSGLNVAGTGLLFTISYLVVHATPGTPIYYPSAPGCGNGQSSPGGIVCVTVDDSFGGTIPENIQGATVFTPIVIDPTTTVVVCGSPIVVGQPTICTATVTDTAPSGATAPTGIVAWTTSGIGVFSPSVCTLSPINAFQSQCSISIISLSALSTIICAAYSGDVTHSRSIGCTTLSVLKATPSLGTSVIVDQTGLPVNATTGVLFGLSVHDSAFLFDGFPITGVTGLVTYTLYPNGLCTAGTGTVVSTVIVGPANHVPPSASVTPNATGSWSFNAMYSGDFNNNAVTSACEPFTVTPAPSFFTGGKLHWTHHLSLSKAASSQSWTAVVENPLSANIEVVIRIVGMSAVNPSLGFDVTCGVACVNTGASVNLTPGLTPVLVTANTKSLSFSFSQTISSLLVNQKISFQATVYWTTGKGFSASTTKTGSFAVVP